MISVIIPAHNAERTIKGCVGALLSQDYGGEYEIIVADDGSTDGTAKALKGFPKGKVRLLRLGHKGPAAARNAGAGQAKGDIVLFTDADCIPGRDWVSQMARPFLRRNITGVQGAYKTRQRGIVARFAQLEIEERYSRLAMQEYTDWIGSYSAGYRKAAFLEFGGFDESYPMASGEDPDLSYKMARAGYKLVFNQSAVVYHMHPETLSRYAKQKYWRAVWRVRLYKKNKEKIASESYTPWSLKLQIALFYLFFISAIALPLSGSQLIVAVICIAFLLSTIPLSIPNARKDAFAGIATPFFVVVRTAAFASGLLRGYLLLLSGAMKD